MTGQGRDVVSPYNLGLNAQIENTARVQWIGVNLEEKLQYFVYGAPMLFVWVLYLLRRTAIHKQSLEVHREATEAGLTEPASLHPL
ncbi:MAG: hypothetical protein ACR2RB_18920, partial [Gammaproteobacteria bacterium]